MSLAICRHPGLSANTFFRYSPQNQTFIILDFGGLTTAQRLRFEPLRTIKPPTKEIGGFHHVRNNPQYGFTRNLI